MAKQRVVLPVLLLLLTLVGVAALLELLGVAVMLPGAGMFVWIALGLALFLGSQLLIFRMLGLRARADEPPADEADVSASSDEPSPAEDPEARGRPDEPPEGDADWRAWRG